MPIGDGNSRSFNNCNGKQHNFTISRDTYRKANEQKRRGKVQFGPLTMIDARGARRNQASNILRDDFIIGSSILLQFYRTLYKAIAEHRIASSIMRGKVMYFCVSLTDQDRTRFGR